MKYRIHIRSYLDLCRPYITHFMGFYDIGEATEYMRTLRADRAVNALGCDVWLVPV